MKNLLLAFAVALVATISLAAQDEHADHAHGHADEGRAHDMGLVSINDASYRITSYSEITPGTEAVISIDVEQGKAPGELRAWVGARNGRGSVKTLLRADSHGHFHGHLEVPAKLPVASAIWLDVDTAIGRQRGAVSIPDADHAHTETMHSE